MSHKICGLVLATLGFIGVCGVLAHAQPPAPQEGKARPRDGADGGVPIPRNLEEALDQLIRESTAKQREEFKMNGSVAYHHGLGTSLRNNWGLWRGSPLAQWFRERGIRHPDDMSGIILTSLDRRLRGEDIDLDGQIAYYQAYWKKQRELYENGTSSGRMTTHLVKVDARSGQLLVNGDNIPFVNEFYGAIREQAGQAVRRCWEALPNTPGERAVETVLELMLDDQGRLGRARVQKTGLSDRDAECLARALIGVSSPQHRGGHYTVSLNAYRTGKTAAGPSAK